MRGSSEPKLEGFFGTIWKRIGQINDDCLLCFVALCLRAEEPETDATDGNVGEGRRELPAVAEPASSSLNATLETFTQMMATMTQMLKNIQAPASGSGGGPIGGSSGGPGIDLPLGPAVWLLGSLLSRAFAVDFLGACVLGCCTESCCWGLAVFPSRPVGFPILVLLFPVSS
ncbi:hypothetical protein M5K25_012030 [Dendrobium thyrsiflorum]|uniref:Uncharacterized protein n=1 Tax=Dendrobium thyrsiflorum TaxID=117978 RepID=A0ABD0V4E3_DENTH